MANTYSQVACQCLSLAPVAVRGVQYLGLSYYGHGEELSIRWIEPVLWQLRKSAALIRARCNWDDTHRLAVMHVVQHVLEENISHARSAREVKVSPVFPKNAVSVVQNDSMALTKVFEHLDTLPATDQIRMCITSIRHYCDVSVYHEISHCDASIRLSSDALLIAAISPTSSPKNLGGQFVISPNSLRAKSLSVAIP